MLEIWLFNIIKFDDLNYFRYFEFSYILSSDIPVEESTAVWLSKDGVQSKIQEALSTMEIKGKIKTIVFL